jgi:hypothetical protein
MKTDAELDGNFTARPLKPSGRPPAYIGVGAQPEFFNGEGGRRAGPEDIYFFYFRNSVIKIMT